MKSFRTVKATRQVPHTVGGQTHMVTEPYEEQKPVRPVDLDQLVRNALWVITALVVTGAIIWSTVAIGNLLSSMAPMWVSYLVAVVFDMAWVACMGAEWLMRYDRRRATPPRVAGWLALGVSVAAIVIDGHAVTGNYIVGAAGGVVSVLAKGLWLVVMMISARPLSGRDQQWYEQAASATDAQLALTAAQRKLARTQALVRQERAALEDTYAGLSPSVPVLEDKTDRVPVPSPVSPEDRDTRWVFEDKTYRAGLPVPVRTEDTKPVPGDVLTARTGQTAGSVLSPGTVSASGDISVSPVPVPEDTSSVRPDWLYGGDGVLTVEDTVSSDEFHYTPEPVPMSSPKKDKQPVSPGTRQDDLSSRRGLSSLIEDIRGRVGDNAAEIRSAVLATPGFEDTKRNSLNTAVRRALAKSA